MAKAERYDDLIFQLGDLARDRLAGRPGCPPPISSSMDRVYRAEAAVVARREELAALEARLNEADAAHEAFQEAAAQERSSLQATVKRWKRAVDAIDGRVRELRKRLSTRRAELRYAKEGLAKLEARHADLELTTQDEAKLAVSRDNLKKQRLAQMRQARELEDLEYELAQALTPKPGQPGAEGILAHKRLIELEDEEQARKEAFDARMAQLDQAIAAKEGETQAAEDFLDQSLFLLGEDVYASRVPDAALAALYPRLDRAG
ncbi:hypothetical protein FGE12_16665 [Aggregicoccus sp. 17bor-14]|uniref:hypothetical protein n=1 Tax=Myxococcaceae TaxID=31 RepID=UPI00129C779C|nr:MULTISPECIES: hypothetical protein [Myxococcaceae]MBF5044033.1 hypothetical protein [Simulacricoccus sp. 17bor-14]MRI89784.1 hypothetical protein [Aggregicoccus sp. 17bor-14]